jgi:hypothetical protein
MPALARHDEQGIEDFVEITHALARHGHLRSDGEYKHVEVEHNRADDKNPNYFRVKMPMEGMNFKVIETAHEHGLRVEDTWALTSGQARQMLSIRLNPDPNQDDE